MENHDQDQTYQESELVQKEQKTNKVLYFALAASGVIILILTFIIFKNSNSEQQAPKTVTEEPDVTTQESVEETMPLALIRANDTLYLLENNSLTEVPLGLTEGSRWDEKLSPSGDRIALAHWNPEFDGAAKFRSGKTGISIIETKLQSLAYQKETLIPSGTSAHTYLSWSPDGRYLSYIVDDGRGIGVYDTTNKKEMFRFYNSDSPFDTQTQGYGPIVWINEEEFSYVFEGKLYVGTPSNPQSTVIAEGVLNVESHGEWEGPPVLNKPLWSSDGNFVTYRTEDSWIMKNRVTKKEYGFAEIIRRNGSMYQSVNKEENQSVADGGTGSATWSAHEVGWTENNEFLYKVGGKLKIAKRSNSDDLETGYVAGFPKYLQNTLIGNGPYITAWQSAESGKSPYIDIIDLTDVSVVCPNLDLGEEYLTSHVSKHTKNVYVIAKRTAEYTERALGVYNITSCESLGNFVLEEDTSRTNPYMRITVQTATN